MKIIRKYKNGNYNVVIWDNGTKIRYSEDDEFIPEFPENIDIKLTNACPYGCMYCHENSKNEDATKSINFLHNYIFGKSQKWIETLRPGTEVALGGGALSTLDNSLWEFISVLNNRDIIVNMTINQREMSNTIFMDTLKFHLQRDIVKGVGVSFLKADQELEKFAKIYRKNIVIHVIAGIVTPDELEYLAKNRFKVLILGYKDLRRGHTYLESNNEKIKKNIQYIKDNIKRLSSEFLTTSFDCLAVEQLDIGNVISKKDFEKYYMGDDGTHTMYIDIPNLEYAPSSTYPIGRRLKINSKLSIEDMFKTVREITEKEKKFDRITNK